jgi:CRP-like cAMP-binding protein
MLEQARPAPPIDQNLLLRTLPAGFRDGVAMEADLLHGKAFDLLQKEGEPYEYVYFALDSIISVLTLTGNAEIEGLTVGNEGFVGLPVLLGGHAMPMRVIVQVPGEYLRLPVTTFRRLLEACPDALPRMYRYAQYVLTQAMQTAGCNRAHKVEARCARWLCMTHDRVSRDQFILKQEILAQMLGVRRASVSEVASDLQRQGLIRYSRGKVTIVDRAGLERLACPCYCAVRRELERLLG